SLLTTGLALLVVAQSAAAATRIPRIKGPWVAVHLLHYETDADLQAIERQLPELQARGVNILLLEVDFAFQFRSHPELRLPGKAITLGGARHFTKECRKYGIHVIPQFQSLGHQSWAKDTWPLLTKYPELDTTPGAFPGNEGVYCREWDPMNPKVY